MDSDHCFRPSCRVFAAVGLFISSLLSVVNAQDLAHWTRADPRPTSMALLGVERCGGEFVIRDMSGGVWQSPDGAEWTPTHLFSDLPINSSGMTTNGDSDLRDQSGFLGGVATWDGRVFVRLGSGQSIQTSVNGYTWTGVAATGLNLDLGAAITFRDGYYVTVGRNGSLAWATNRTTWSSTTITGAGQLSGVAYGGGWWVVCGQAGGIYRSADLQHWTKANSGTDKHLSDVTWTGWVFVAVGMDGTVVSSSDGLTWQVHQTPTHQDLQSVVSAGDRVVVVGNGGEVILAGGPPAVTGLSSWRQQLQADGLTYPLGITAHGAWAIREAPDWIILSAQSGSGDQTVSVTVLPNLTGNERLAILEIGGEHHTVVQSAMTVGASVAISPVSRDSNGLAESYVLNITTSGPWDLGSLPNWLTASTTAGTGDATVTLSLAANSTSSWRQASLQVGSVKHDVSQRPLQNTPFPPTVTVRVPSSSGTRSAYTVPSGSMSWMVPRFIVSGVTAETTSIQWRHNGVAIPGATSRFYWPLDISMASTGTYDAIVEQAGTTYTLAGATLDVTAPDLVLLPDDQAVAAGDTAWYALTGGMFDPVGNTFTWYRDGEPVGPAQLSSLSLTPQFGEGGNYRLRMQTSAGEVYWSTESHLGVALGAGGGGYLANLSVRNQTGTGAAILTVGFVTEGGGREPMVLRGIGPGLEPFGVTDFLPDPTLRLFDAASNLTDVSDNWSGDDGRSLGAFPLPDGSVDAVISASFGSGLRTAQVSDASGATGESLVELYHGAAGSADLRLVNLSTRTVIPANGEVQAGFVVGGIGTANVLVRAVGPTLANFDLTGLAEDPRIELNQLTKTGAVLVTQNDDWSAELAATAELIGAFALPFGSADAAVVATLSPGNYTALVRNKAGKAGLVLVEVYLIQP